MGLDLYVVNVNVNVNVNASCHVGLLKLYDSFSFFPPTLVIWNSLSSALGYFYYLFSNLYA